MKILVHRLNKLIVTMFLVSTMIGSTPALSYAAGFWNYTPYTVMFFFTSEGCPWVVRLICGETYVLPPAQNGIPGSMSSNNAAGTVEIGGHHQLLRDDRLNYYSYDFHEIEVGRQDYITFALDGETVIRMRIHRSDTGANEYAELTFWDRWASPRED